MTPQLSAVPRAHLLMERLGWQVLRADIAIGETDRAVIVLKRLDDGRLVTFEGVALASGVRRASLTVEFEVERIHVLGRRGDRMPTRRRERRLLSRTAYSGPRAGLRGLASYLADNCSAAPSLARMAVRALCMEAA